jgi:hypothetical protein
MAGAGTVLHREKTVWKLHWLLLFAPIATFIMSGVGFAGLGSKPMPLAVAAALLPIGVLTLALWAMFISLRVTVSVHEVVVQYGLFGPRIPIDGIDKCEVRDYPQLAFGGGIKRVDGAWAYTLFGQGTRALRIEWRDASGSTHATILTSPDPDKLAATIQRARTKTRVAPASPDEINGEADREAVAESDHDPSTVSEKSPGTVSEKK